MLRAFAALGVATLPEAADYFRLQQRDCRVALDDLIQSGAVAPVDVEGWPSVAFATTSALEGDLSIPLHPPVLLSPFDSILWVRERVLRLFGFKFLLELYTPKSARTFGYYVVPLLAQGKLCGRADLKHDRPQHVVRVHGLWLDGASPEDAACALRDLATHLHAHRVDAQSTHPISAHDAVERALVREGISTHRTPI
jgi:uncharacterized protein YcaQ